ncbi:MAG: hypothetical protein FJZ57_02680 [Chlamydiae bacterium]|nr:hypothetical protein [Chlamydiota bacterium]
MKSRSFVFLIVFAFLTSCGYRFSPMEYEGEKVSISIPYIQGDPEASLNNQLISTLTSSGRFSYVQSDSDYFLQVVILSDNNDLIGYRYDRDKVSGARKQNILSVENRRIISSQVTMYNSRSGQVVFGPVPISATVDYDYVDYGSPKDLNTNTSSGTIPTIRYSYGQLDTVEGAHDDASLYVYKKLSQKILECVANRLF